MLFVNSYTDICTTLILDGDYMPFVKLGSTAGVNRVFLVSSLDSKSGNITITVPFSFGSTTSTSLSVSHITVYFCTSNNNSCKRGCQTNLGRRRHYSRYGHGHIGF